MPVLPARRIGIHQFAESEQLVIAGVGSMYLHQQIGNSFPAQNIVWMCLWRLALHVVRVDFDIGKAE